MGQLNFIGAAIINKFSDLVFFNPKSLIFFISVVIFFPLIFSTFSLIDDHEIFLFLTTYKAKGFVATMQSLVWFPDIGPIQRFRPVYYLMRALETVLLQDKAIYWVAVRFSIAMFFSLSVYDLLKLFLPNYWALVGAIFMLCAPWTADVFFRFGPAECYAVLFLGLLIFSLTSKKGVNWLGVALSISMLIGIKENFLILMPLLFVSIYCLFSKRRYISGAFVLGLLVLSTLCLVIIIQKLTSVSGVDIYGQDVGKKRLFGLVCGLFLSAGGLLSLAIFSIFFCFSINKNIKHDAKTGLVLFSVVVFAFFNLYFYGDVPSLKSRYAIPYWPMLLVTSAILFYELKQKTFRGISLGNGNAKTIMPITILLLLVAFNDVRAYQQTIRTMKTEKSIASIVDKSKYFQDIIVNVGGYYDLEPLASIARYLDFYRVYNTRYVNVDQENIINRSPLMSDIIRIYNKGSSVYGYEPLANHPNNQYTCLEIYFRPNTKSACNERVMVPF